MKEVAGAVIATSLVLVAVFVPVAFFPGTTGILFRQFALTIAFSISISAFNALTLTPSLSAILLGHSGGQKNWFFRRVDAAISATTEGYRRALRAFLGVRWLAVILFFAGLASVYFVFERVPKGFVPDEDQGYFIIAVQCPPGASLQYTKAIEGKVQALVTPIAEVEGTFAISGFSFSGNAANYGIVFVPLKPYRLRKGDQHSATAVVNSIRGQAVRHLGRARASPFCLPRCRGSASSAALTTNCRIRPRILSKNLPRSPKPGPAGQRAQGSDRSVQQLYRE
jgi:HAE1 family hydrophobic/amphiphilic exporter-1